MAIYDITTTTIDPSVLAVGDIINCPYSGAMKTIKLPIGAYKLEVWGAMGGYRSSNSYAGKGGYSVGTVALTEATNVYLYSGGQGNSASYYSSPIYNGGFNGGGKRYNYHGGGGASDVRIGTDSLYARVIVAGGGASDGASAKLGMYGGGTAGGDNTQSYGTGGYGGTQTGNSSGSWSTTAQTNTATSQTDCYSGFGFGGNGIYLSSGYGGAGGGGWYGGTGGCPDGSGDDDRGGGGGSGFIYTSDTASNVPTGWLLTSSYYLTSASTTNGASTITLPSGSTGTGVSDNGYVRITVITITQANNNNIYININGAWKQINQVYENINGTWTI